MECKRVSVLVAGGWGAALATVLAENGHQVTIWSRNEQQVKEINQQHQNQRYLPDINLPEHIIATTSMQAAVETAEWVVLAAPSAAMRQVVGSMKPYLQKNTRIIHASKGFEVSSLLRMSEVISSELPDYDKKRILVLSGPSHAEEVVRQKPTTVVVAAEDSAAAEEAQDLLMNSYFRVYTNTDIVGVEVSGSLKNIIALGAGLADGLQFGDNAKAALMTRGLAEISRLGVAMGANPLTFAGLAGIGDLIVTCTSRHSRNWRAGYLIAQGRNVTDVLAEMGMVVEGIQTTKSAYALASKYQIPMPITTELFQVLFDHKAPLAAVEDLMGRGKTKEMEADLHLSRD